jgi:hypothetical protein
LLSQDFVKQNELEVCSKINKKENPVHYKLSTKKKTNKSSCLDISGIDIHQSNLMPTGQTMETFMILNVKHIFEKPSVCLHDEKTKHSGYH